MPFKIIDEGRPAGFDTHTTTQDVIEQIQDSEMANKIEKTRTDVLRLLHHDRRARPKVQEREERPRPDPQNIECPVCNLVTTTGQRSVMVRVEESPENAGGDQEWDTEAYLHEVYYHCSNCNTRIYRDDPSFEDLSHISPHDALQVVAINDPNSNDTTPIIVAKQNKFSKARRKQDRQDQLSRILDKLS